MYLLVVVIIGVAASRFQRTEEDFWVAGRRFGLGILVIANVAAIMHGGSILSGIAFTGAFGGPATTPFLAFAGGIAVVFFWIAKKLRRSGGFTIPDYMGDRFDSMTLRAWSACVVAFSSIIYLSAQIRGMAFILESLLDIPFLWGVLLGTVIFVFYVALGGLLAIVWTNIAQFIFMWVGLLILLPPLLERIGGWTSVMTSVEVVSPGWTSLTGTGWTGLYMISWFIVWFVAYSTRIEFVTKMYAARDDRVARQSLPWTALLIILFLLYGIIYLGAAARLLVWDQIGSPDQAFPVMVQMLLSPTMAAIALTGIASAAMSTTDSLLLMSGSAIAHDLLRKCHDEPKGIVRDERYYLKVSRITIVVIGAIACLCALPDMALLLQIVSYAVAIVGSAFFFPLVFGLNVRRISSEAALASSIGGVCVTVAWIIAVLLGQTWAKGLHPIIPGLITAGTLMLVVTLRTSPVKQQALDKFF
jgi:Na+/proline symporter